jgi:hypothetical protein
MLAPYRSAGTLTILLEHAPESATTAGDRVTSVSLHDLRQARTRTIAAKYFLDATELGDLLPLTKTEFVTGSGIAIPDRRDPRGGSGAAGQ